MANATLSPTSGPVGTSVVVNGTGFGRKQAGTIKFGAQQVATFRTNARGMFNTSFAVPTVNPAPYVVTVQSSSGSATKPFTVTAVVVTPPPDPTPEPEPTPIPPTGITVQPCTAAQLQAIIDGQPSGTTFVLQSGEYAFDRFVIPRNGDRLISATPRGAILKLDGYAGIKNGGNADVTLEGVVLDGGTYPWDGTTWPRSQVLAGARWICRNVEWRNGNKSAIELSDGCQILGGYMHHQGRYGFTGGPNNDITIDGLEMSFLNMLHEDLNDAGGSKIVGSSKGALRIAMRNIHAHDIYGNALWCDWAVKNVVYENNNVHDNYGCGIFHEASDVAVIRNNVLSGNCMMAQGHGIQFGADIYLNDSRDVDIYGNTVDAGVHGICGWDSDRGSTLFGPLSLCNVKVHDNHVTAPGTRIGYGSSRTNPCATPWMESNNS